MSKVKNIDEFYKLKSQENHALEEATGIANQLFKTHVQIIWRFY